MSIALNWFVNESYDSVNEVLLDNTATFADLNLEVWGLDQGVFTDLIATSTSLYNNSEYLRILLDEAGEYGFRVTFDDIIYDATGLFSEEDYAIAWSTAVIPEPATLLFVLVLLAGAPIVRIGRRRV